MKSLPTADGTGHAAQLTDVKDIIDTLKDMVNTYLGESDVLDGKMDADKDDPHSHYAYRMVEWGENKQLREIIYGTKNASGTKIQHGLYDIIHAYDGDTIDVFFKTKGIAESGEGTDNVAGFVRKYVKGVPFNLPDVSDCDPVLVPPIGYGFGGWFLDKIPKTGAVHITDNSYNNYSHIYALGGSFTIPDELVGNKLELTLRRVKLIVNIEFDLNGGSGDFSATVMVRVEDQFIAPSGSSITPPTGKAFVGWGTADVKDGSVPSILANDTVVYDGSYSKLYAIYITKAGS